MEDPELTRITLVLQSPGKGKGLFARIGLTKGTVVAKMRAPGRMLRSEIQEYFRLNPHLPEDSVVYVERSPLVFYDRSWDGTRRVPYWYRLNHSRNPNCKPRIVDNSKPPREQEIEWVLIPFERDDFL